MKFALASLTIACALILAGCGPTPAPAPSVVGPTGGCKTTPAAPADVAVALHEAFTPVGGQPLVEASGRVLCCESGWGSNAVNGQYLGLFQLNVNLYGPTIRFYSVKRFGYESTWAVFDAWVNAQVARDSYLSRGGCQP